MAGPCAEMDGLSELDQLPVHVWRMQDEGTLCWMNRLHAEFLGVDARSLAGRSLEDFLPPETAARCREGNRRVLESGRQAVEEEWVVGRDGRRHCLMVTRTPLFDAGGGVRGLLGSALEITARREAEARLEQSEENHRRLVETLDDLVVIADLTGRILHANPATYRKLGYAPGELLGREILELHPAWVRAEAELIMAAMFAGERNTCPLPLVTRGGRLLAVETRVWKGTWDGGPCIIGLSSDREAEQESMRRFETLFRRNPAPMAINDMDEMAFLDVNDAFLVQLGLRHEDVVGRTAAQLGLFPRVSDQERAAHLVRTYGRVQDVELLVRDRSGGLHTGLFSGELIEIQGRRCFLTVMVDISERIRAAEEREMMIVELRAALAQIKTLRGIVPICARCKSIRDDEGYWQQLESYVSQHTGASFSHGLCPSCAREELGGTPPSGGDAAGQPPD